MTASDGERASAWDSLREDATQVRDDVERWWARHGGLDGLVRVGGAVAVVATIESLAGYYLWIGMTTQVGVPDALGWTLQAGLAGGSAVGTRAFHRGDAEDKWWGLVASVLAIPAGSLAVVALVECLVVGYLTVHTLMAAPPRQAATPAAAATGVVEPVEDVEDVEDPAGGEDSSGTEDDEPRTEEVPLPPPPVEPDEEEPTDDDGSDDGSDDEDADDGSDDEDADDGSDDEDADDGDEDQRDAGGHPIDHRLIAWHALTKEQAQAEARRLTARGHRVTQSRKTLESLREDVRDARRALGEEPAA